MIENWRQTFVCCACRKSARRKWSVPTCPFCNESMTGIGTKWRIPKKDDDKGWELLEALIKTAQADLEDQHSRHPHIQTKHVRLSGHTLYSFKKGSTHGNSKIHN